MNSRISIVICGVVYSIISLFVPITIYAQEEGLVLEEIIVTAQRRVQSLQDVPLSITTFSGGEIREQGFKELQDLARFEPQVQIDGGTMDSDVYIRGVGTAQFAVLFEQSAPIFVDDVHLSRASQVKTAFLDVERLEVLKGPQPVYFGQNAVAGAFRIESAKPTTNWEGYANAEYGNFKNRKIEAAVGGPITDTIGIRVAAKWDSQDGYIKDIVDPGNRVGWFGARGGRIILAWQPTNNFSATGKFETSYQKRDVSPDIACHIPGNVRYDRRQLPSDQTATSEGAEFSIFLPPPRGSATGIHFRALDRDCSGTNYGTNASGHSFAPQINLRAADMTTGILDVREATDVLVKRGFAPLPFVDEFKADGLHPQHDKSKSYMSYIDLNYRFNNGIELASLSSFTDYQRNYIEDNRNSLFMMRFQNRLELLKSYSSEFRITSPANGFDLGDDVNFEFMAGFYWQDEDYDFAYNTTSADGRRGIRANRGNQGTTWNSVFGTMTFNFLDGKASVDLGGRYANIKKDAAVGGVASQWVYDVTPCAPGPLDHQGGGDTDPDNCVALHPDAIPMALADVVLTSRDPVDTTNLWILDWRGSREAPPTWRGTRAHAIGHTPFGTNWNTTTFTATSDMDIRQDGPRFDEIDESQFDPQITLRYRLTQDISFFARWAKAFKASGFDGAVATIPDEDEFRFDSERATTYEVGVKGTLWNGRARVNATIFNHKTKNLQLETANPDPDNTNIGTNAAGQRARGIEFGMEAALTDRWRAGINGQVMDSVMTDYPQAGCTQIEFELADTGPCRNLAEAITLGSADLEGTIDRTGATTAFSPEWKVVLNSEYILPVWETYNLTFAANGYYSDGYHTDPRGFRQTVKFGTHGDVNLRLMFGDQEGRWQVGGYARSLIQARQKYFAENDVEPNGVQTIRRARDAHRQYGVNFRYNYF